MNRTEAIEAINRLAAQRVPFLCITDFLGQDTRLWPLAEINPKEVFYSIHGKSNVPPGLYNGLTELYHFNKTPISFDAYKLSFDRVMNHLRRGDSYLTNLTCTTPIGCNLNLQEIFFKSQAKYRLFVKDAFVVFSPEIFVQINEGRIYSFPMKGTIDAQVPQAAELILADKKESAEHATIVDLIRNDLSRIATDVKVDKYRYIDTLDTNSGQLLQVSSQISGKLPLDYLDMLGSILFELLPAGSISGAPKEKTMEIILGAETHQRGFYTGIVGLFDGQDFDSGVLIRFVEEKDGKLFFKSGGGITVNSQAESEYAEMVQKVYLPFV